MINDGGYNESLKYHERTPAREETDRGTSVNTMRTAEVVKPSTRITSKGRDAALAQLRGSRCE